MELFEHIRKTQDREELSIRELARRFGVHRRTVREALMSPVPAARKPMARVSPVLDTVYELVGRKAVLLRELIEQAISGTDHAVAPDERGYVQAIKAEPHPATKLAIYAHATCRIQERMAPLLLALRDASSTEPEANQIWHEISNRRAENMRHLIRDIQDFGGLRGDLTIDEAADVLWALNTSEVFLLFTAERGWSIQKLEHWLSDTWRLVLLN